MTTRIAVVTIENTQAAPKSIIRAIVSFEVTVDSTSTHLNFEVEAEGYDDAVRIAKERLRRFASGILSALPSAPEA